MNTSASQSFSLEDLQALNAEILALVQAGVPLELGLRSVADDNASALRRLTTDIADRMEQGASLAEALEAEGDRMPQLYRELVEAGLQANRLSAALEALSDLVEQLIQVRRCIGIALLYPLIVASVGYAVFLMFLLLVVSTYEASFQGFQLETSGVMGTLVGLRASWPLWSWAPPVLVCLAVIWWFRLGQSRTVDATDPTQGLNWLPGVGAMLRNYRRASFARLLAAMVEQDLALDRAVVLAANCVGGRDLRNSARDLAIMIQRGHGQPGASVSDASRALPGIPPLLRWLLLQSKPQQSLQGSLRQAAALYRHRADDMSHALRVMLPVKSVFLFVCEVLLARRCVFVC